LNVRHANFTRVSRSLARLRRRDGPPLLLCIDVEPDPRLVERDNPAPWRGFERFVAELPNLRDRLEAVGARAPRFTWFLRMDPQIADTWGSAAWVNDEYGEALRALQEQGDELGLHMHTWRWEDTAGAWVADREDPEWIEHCMTMALDAFEASFGRRCRAHRGGDRQLSPEMLSVLVARGVEVDLTVEPGLPPAGALAPEEHARGTTPDYREAPTQPYRFGSASDFLSPDPRGGAPLMIPLLAAPDGNGGRAPLYLWTEPATFASRLDALLAQASPLALAFGIRTDLPLIPEWDWFIENLECLAAHPSLRRSRFVTASEAAADLQQMTNETARAGAGA
jgi:hypothetical protein